MDLRFSAEELAFRDELRGFIRDNLPADIGERMRHGHAPRKEDIVAWQRILNKRGWAAYSWPKEYGGPGWTPVQRMIFLEEIQTGAGARGAPVQHHDDRPGADPVRHPGAETAVSAARRQCRRLVVPGLFGARRRLGPCGAEDRREARGRRVRRQRPENLDLDRAPRRLVLLPGAHQPAGAKSQEGISFLLIDMKTPGITVRPIISIDGSHHLNEVFFDDVRVPAAMLVGEENKGWDVAKFLLGNERTGIARLGKSKERVKFAKEAAQEMRAGGSR